MGELNLLYGIDELEHAIFAPRALVDELREARRLLRTCTTWGDAKAILPRRSYRQLIEDWADQPERPPSDDAPLPEEPQMVRGEWPLLSYGQIRGWLPAEVYDEFAEEVVGFLSAWWVLPVFGPNDEDRLSLLLEALGRRGIRCEADPDLSTLFAVE